MKGGRPRKYRGAPASEIAANRAEASRIKAQGEPGEMRVVTGAAAKIISAMRRDVFTILHARGALSSSALIAVRLLDAELARSLGCAGGSSGMGVRVDTSLVPSSVYRRLEADERCAAILDRMHRPFRDLILALLTPQYRGERTDWRAIVRRVTGIEREEIQADRVRQAAEDVAHAIGGLR